MIVPILLTALSAPSWVASLSPEEQRVLVNRLPDDPSALRAMPTRSSTELLWGAPPSLPPTFSWRDRDGVQWLMPVRNQRQCGSCAAFAITSLLEAEVKIELDEPGLDVDLSDSQCLTCAGGSCSQGISLVDGLSVLLSRGLPTEECAPYQEGGVGQVTLTDCDGGCEGWSRGLVRLDDVVRIQWDDGDPLETQVAAMKVALLDGPLLVAIDVYADLFDYEDGVYAPASEDPSLIVGGHALLLVGWDDALGAWEVRNSWGGNWGRDGYLYLRWGASGSHVQVWSAVGADAGALFDFDGDGFAAVDQGGRDCNDWDAAVHLGADEVLDDGVDQDCDGFDAESEPPPLGEGCGGSAFLPLLAPAVRLTRRRKPRAAPRPQ